MRVIRKADGSGHRLVGVMIDITDQKRIEETLAYRATHDTLTGLLNREQLDIELARVHRLPNHGRSLFLDLNGFKDVNDGLGHSIGDEVLRIVAKRLSGATRPDDIVARFGGDEFCILASVQDQDTALTIANRLREAIQRPTNVGGHSLRLTITVGIAYVGAERLAGDAAAPGRRRDVQREVARHGCRRLRTVDAEGRAVAAERLGRLVGGLARVYPPPRRQTRMARTTQRVPAATARSARAERIPRPRCGVKETAPASPSMASATRPATPRLTIRT